MKGSDFDMMYVFSNVHVYEDINKVRLNSTETSFVMDMDDCFIVLNIQCVLITSFRKLICLKIK